ncbi:MAG: twin transmembrane helix small protein [Alphaproteobacteria bacterium]|nr:twin transmembrane helix small protein [Alphaproteobacteria bacterium]
MVLVVGVLLAGVFTMMKGGEANRKHSAKLMMARVALQALAVGLLGVMYLMSK